MRQIYWQLGSVTAHHYHQVCFYMGCGGLQSGQWALEVVAKVGNSSRPKRPILHEIAIAAYQQFADLWFQAVNDMRDQWFAMPRNQPFVPMSCAATFTAGQYDSSRASYRCHKTRVYLPCRQFLMGVCCVIIASI